MIQAYNPCLMAEIETLSCNFQRWNIEQDGYPWTKLKGLHTTLSAIGSMPAINIII
jgi:hypothetical protein